MVSKSARFDQAGNASVFAALLRDNDFSVTELGDADRAGMAQALSQFSNGLASES